MKSNNKFNELQIKSQKHRLIIANDVITFKKSQVQNQNRRFKYRIKTIKDETHKHHLRVEVNMK